MEDMECYVYCSTKNDYGINKHESRCSEIPCYPDEVSDSVSVNWSDTSIIGRTPILAYNGTGLRNISFSMDLHIDMYTGYGTTYSATDLSHKIEVLLSTLRSCAYPNYESSGLKPPMVMFVFGKLMMRGVLRSVSYTWKKPIIDKQYSVCSVSINMDEIVDPNHCEGRTISSQSSYNPNNLNHNYNKDSAEWIDF